MLGEVHILLRDSTNISHNSSWLHRASVISNTFIVQIMHTT